MVEWTSLAQIAHDEEAFTKFMHALLGVYIWEVTTSFDFDWQYISGKKRIRWPIIFYFAGRYSLLFAVIGLIIGFNVMTEVNCRALYTFIEIFGNASIGFASINLSFRTMVVWSWERYVAIPVVAAIAGHWSILLRIVLVRTVWVSPEGCVITSTNNHLLAILLVYTMVFDFVVLCLTGCKLASAAHRRSMLATRILGDGLIYFIIACLSNLLATIFVLLNLNPVMSIIGNVPAATASTIAACRVVRHLLEYTCGGPQIFAITACSSPLVFRPQDLHCHTSAVSNQIFDDPETNTGCIPLGTTRKEVKKTSLDARGGPNHILEDGHDVEVQANSESSFIIDTTTAP